MKKHRKKSIWLAAFLAGLLLLNGCRADTNPPTAQQRMRPDDIRKASI